MDNAPYHSVTLNKIPNTSTKKGDIIQWLQRKEIQFSAYEIKNQCKMYELDQLANERGHEVIRLPPYHCHYNPIENVWSQVKRGVANKSKTFNMKDTERFVKEEIDIVTKRNENPTYTTLKNYKRKTL